MRRLTISLAAMALFLAGCQKPELVEPAADNLSFEATVEEFGCQTKTSLTSENYIVWSEGDRLAIFQGSAVADEYQLAESSAGSCNGSFDLIADNSANNGSFSVGTGQPCNVSFYPYAADLNLTGEAEGYVLSNVLLPATQTYVANSFGSGSFPMVAVTESMSDHKLMFRNILGAVKLSLKGSQVVKSIAVEGLNGEKLSGAATVTAYANNIAPAIKMLNDASTVVTLFCGDGVQLNQSQATDFYIALPPVSFEKGFTVTVKDKRNQKYTMSAGENNTVLRSSILVMPAVNLPAPAPSKYSDYVDEYGINHGPGVEIDDIVWAPVNCGYHATYYKWGKLYQWGRKYGQGAFEDATSPENVEGGISLSAGNHSSKSNVFFTSDEGDEWDWVAPRNSMLWNAGTEESPIKTKYDPCPSGWRVPTLNELIKLVQNRSEWTTNDANLSGYWFSGTKSYSEDVLQIFLPAAGGIGYHGIAFCSRNMDAYYWSSTPYDNVRACLIGFFNGGANWYFGGRANGVSVRCVQDLSSGDPEGDVPSEDEQVIPVAYVKLNTTALTLYEGVVAKLTASARPYDTTEPIGAVWSSDDQAIATVDQTGLVTAISEGTTMINVEINGKKASCALTVKALDVTPVDYIDEYGINHGKGTLVGRTVWAPVNCGYHATDYKWGKLYQWGRKYGQGYDGGLCNADGEYVGEAIDAKTPTLVEGPVSLAVGNNESNANVFYIDTNNHGVSGSDWLIAHDNTLWNAGTDESPVKTEYDPCPAGWRVPTYNEFGELVQNRSEWITNGTNQSGYSFCGTSSYSESVPQVFFPAAGLRQPHNGSPSFRGDYSGYYWSSKPSVGNETDAYCLILSVQEGGAGFNAWSRAFGFSVRCVQD